MREDGVAILLLPTHASPGLIMFPAGVDPAEIPALVIVRCGGLGPEAFDQSLLRAVIATAGYIAVTSLPRQDQEHIAGIAAAHAVDGVAMLIESPLHFERAWVDLVINCGGVGITQDRRRRTARTAADWRGDFGDA